MTKPAEDPKVAEPDQQAFAPDACEQQPEDPASNTQSEMLELSVDQTNIDPSTTEPSSSLNPPETYVDDILITGTGFTELGNPTVLARHSAKQEVMERRKVRFDVSHYAQLSSSEVLSGYLNQVHSSRDLEIEMVRQMHQKYEVCHPAYIGYVYPASRQVF